jgi:hypothetical protein
MKRCDLIVGLVLGTMAAAMAMPALGQGEKEGQGQVIVTVLPKQEGGSAAAVPAQDMTVKVNGKDARVTGWEALRGSRDPVELVVLIDGSARTSLGRELNDLTQFVNSLPPNIRSTIGYMENGNAALTGPLTDDHAAVLKGLHIPGGVAGSNASPYFCLSDLAKRWPSQDSAARREVLMVTDGVDEYNRRYDPEDAYVQAAIADSVRAHLVVYSIYWTDQGGADQTQYANNTGQNLLTEVSQATGGKNFWQGLGNPVSFEPFLEELTRRFQNQYELSFVAPLKGKPEVEEIKLKFKAPGSEVDAPQQVFVTQAGVAQE